MHSHIGRPAKIFSPNVIGRSFIVRGLILSRSSNIIWHKKVRNLRFWAQNYWAKKKKRKKELVQFKTLWAVLVDILSTYFPVCLYYCIAEKNIIKYFEHKKPIWGLKELYETMYDSNKIKYIVKDKTSRLGVELWVGRRIIWEQTRGIGILKE